MLLTEDSCSNFKCYKKISHRLEYRDNASAAWRGLESLKAIVYKF